MRAFAAPIALFVYNRPDHTRRTLEALHRNEGADQSRLYIFSDGAKEGTDEIDRKLVCEVRELIRSRLWCNEIEIIESPANKGLAGSIRDGINAVLQSHDRVIVLEDDLVTAPGFLRFMNAALDLYENEPKVMCISSYLPETNFQRFLPETFFLKHMSCWGWGTWKAAWQKCRWDAEELLSSLCRHPGGMHEFDLDGCYPYSDQLVRNQKGMLESWAIFWTASIYLAGGLTLFPRQSLVENIGTDGSGSNFTSDQQDIFRTELADFISVKVRGISESRLGLWYLKSFHKYGHDSRLATRLRRQLGLLKHRFARLAKSPEKWIS